MKTKVSQMTSTKTNNPVANQFKIYTPKGVYFQSYSTLIALIGNNGKIKLDSNYWDYSRTTSKYRNEFLGMNTTETKEAIKNKEIILTNLN
tara:strand:+ start:1958 stop:2230 length:273 start_codon:yes stop_codon:yes gene_type:complete